ncbi:MAG: Rpn family recombination-promoting nuclease/putative transposase [Magnetococcales bacterium]|nr:Rpn family recombination-promoting nuclease/putative transposase [Magnetococcales bacterium]
MTTDHDGLYHQLYSHPRMMSDLVRQFVNEPWVTDLDLEHMEQVKSKFHVPGLPKRESDVIWRIPLRSGSDVYLLVLLEFQSEPDRWMVLRVMVYMCLLWLQLLHEKKIPTGGPLPPLFPVVLHNGDRPWLTPVRLSDLIGLPQGSPLWSYQPDGKFLLIDEGRYPKQDLENRDSLSALVFMVEQCTNLEDLPDLAKAIIRWLERHPECVELRQVLAAMLLNAMNSLSEAQKLPVNDRIDLLEVPTMLQTRMEAWKEAWKNQKLQEWQMEWRREDAASMLLKQMEWRQEEAASMLLKQMRRKFGQTPDWATEKVKAAHLELIETWGENVLFANSVDEVFSS